MELTEPVVRAVVERYARLLVRLRDEIGERPLVLPTGEHFPDAFSGDAKSVKRLVRRMQRHAGMRDIPLDVALVGDEPATGGGGCSSGACATPAAAETELPRLVDLQDGWQLNVPAAETAHPVVLTCNTARSLATIFLIETRAEDESIEEPIDVSVDLTATALGFGVLMLDGSYIYAKSCGGPRVARATKLGPAELGVATALFARLGGHSVRAASKHLEATQREALSEANTWLDSNPELLKLLERQPERVASGDFTLNDPQPWLLRVLRKKKRAADPLEAALSGDVSAEELDSLLATLPAAARRAKPRDPKLDELRALVDQALDEPHGAGE